MQTDPIGTYLILIPAMPLAATLLIALLAPGLAHRWRQLPAALTVVSLLISFLFSWMLIQEIRYEQANRDSAQASFERVYSLWTWSNISAAYHQKLEPPGDAQQPVEGGVRDFNIDITLRADSLTATMLAMVTFVSLLVAVFSIGYMHDDRGYWRFFCYISLFVFSMTMLVSVSNFLMLFVFWEAVGVCSYLLIGFWYQKKEAVAAGKKAFLVNRVGDFGFMLGVFLIWTVYGTMNYHDTAIDAATGEVVYYDADASRTEVPPDSLTAGVLGKSRMQQPYRGELLGLAICLLLIMGACGKSAQFPLHVWLPDAMEGPTPVSALIHAATMVTAGVYMVARCTPLFMASPDAQLIVSCLGAFTALLAGLIALTQFDLKRVLAYSTISQLGYMFLALGTGTFAGVTAGMFHLFTHAFFKALLFLGAGSVMHSMGHVIDMRRFGGLRRVMPITHWTFLFGCLALAGIFPFSGFWSKDGVVAAVHDKAHELTHHAPHDEVGEAAAAFAPSMHGVSLLKASGEASHADSQRLAFYGRVYEVLYWVAVFTAFLTAFYIFRAFFMTFYGDPRVPREAGSHPRESPYVMSIPLVALALCALLVGMMFDHTYLAQPQHIFAGFLGDTPSLAGDAVQATRVPLKFHLTVAGVSTLCACAGLGVAAYLYLGEPREVYWLTEFMQLRWLSRLTDVPFVLRLKRQPWVQGLQRTADALHLGWLTRLVGNLVLLVGLVLAVPLMVVGNYISPYQLSFRKFYFDEIYGLLIVKPLQACAWLSYALDRWLIDALVNWTGRLPVLLGSLMRSLQMGLVQFYALAMVLAVMLLILARLFWIS